MGRDFYNVLERAGLLKYLNGVVYRFSLIYRFLDKDDLY